MATSRLKNEHYIFIIRKKSNHPTDCWTAYYVSESEDIEKWREWLRWNYPVERGFLIFETKVNGLEEITHA